MSDNKASNVIPLRRPAKKRGLCQHGFHQWQVDNAQKFDVKQGRLVTVSVCRRCGKRKVEAK